MSLFGLKVQILHANPYFLSATVAEIAKPEEGRLSGFDLLPRYLTEWRCLTSQDDVGTGGAEAY